MTAPTRTDPIDPFAVTVTDVGDLCGDVQILDAPDPDHPYLTAQITVAIVAQWISDISLMLSARLAERDRITDPARTAHIVAAARTVVINSAASWVEDAAHPTTATTNSTSYARVLEARSAGWTTAVEALITKWIVDGGQDVQPEPGVGNPPLSYGFPDPIFDDWLPW